jgi:hypothetical protein
MSERGWAIYSMTNDCREVTNHCSGNFAQILVRELDWFSPREVYLRNLNTVTTHLVLCRADLVQFA